ncbi:unnamed protein product [Macrosiphum euphorbiae]|uniref:Uncharacterized protein n=1 Tax=Macrosiphum euphorbiae TaxID=13131 RepID=A0AAV0Y7T0_9HEMI|nr:unnamed protein product [Macrosiphum euphorbiae]
MIEIQIKRHPESRNDTRKTDTTTFWSTTLTPTSTVNHRNSKVPNIITTIDTCRTHSTNNIYYGTNYTTNTIKRNYKHLQLIQYFKHSIAITHGKRYNNIKHAIYTDELNNNYLICLNENTTNISNSLQTIKNLEKIAQSLNLNKKTYLRAIFLSEIFICLITQLWNINNIKPSHLLEKIIDITALSATLIMKAGLLHDPVFLIMTGHLGKDRKQFKKIPKASRTFNIQNQNLYYDTYFNVNNSNKYFLSMNYSQRFHRKLTLYFNDSCIINPLIPKHDWIKNLSQEYYTIDNNSQCLGRVISAHTFYNYGFFIVKAPQVIQFRNAVIPNEMGRIYITHYDITPQTLVTRILTRSIDITKDNILSKNRSKKMKIICKKLLNFEIPGLTK